MQRNKDLRTINGELKALVARGDVDPEQKKHVEAAIEELKKLRRKRKSTQADVWSCVRNVAESLLSAYRRN